MLRRITPAPIAPPTRPPTTNPITPIVNKPPDEFGVARYRFWSSPPLAWTIERIEKIATRTRAGIHEMASENEASAGFARLGPRNEPRRTRNTMLTTAVTTEVQRFPLRPR